MNSKEIKLKIIEAGHRAVEQLIKVAREEIIKHDLEDGLSADRLKNAAATKRLAIFDAFEIIFIDLSRYFFSIVRFKTNGRPQPVRPHLCWIFVKTELKHANYLFFFDVCEPVSFFHFCNFLDCVEITGIVALCSSVLDFGNFNHWKTFRLEFLKLYLVNWCLIFPSKIMIFFIVFTK